MKTHFKLARSYANYFSYLFISFFSIFNSCYTNDGNASAVSTFNRLSDCLSPVFHPFVVDFCFVIYLFHYKRSTTKCWSWFWFYILFLLHFSFFNFLFFKILTIHWNLQMKQAHFSTLGFLRGSCVTFCRYSLVSHDVSTTFERYSLFVAAPEPIFSNHFSVALTEFN